MTDYFFDSSALVKRYVLETGTNWIVSICDPQAGNTIFLAQITSVEVVSAIARRRRNRSLSGANAATILNDFRLDSSNQYFFVDITDALINRAITMADNHALRGYDAVQLAAALILQDQRQSLNLPDCQFISADSALNAAAASEGLQTDDPNLH